MSYTNKTQPTSTKPAQYLKENVKTEKKIQEALSLIRFYSDITGAPCVMWNKIFGFGTYHYFDSKGGEHTHLMIGFALSSTGFTIYNMIGWETYKTELQKLGKHKLSGKSCLAIKNLEDIDLSVLEQIVTKTILEMKKRFKIELE